jgi:D-glycero-D-manno-heptose 1,7-bisphosphate phosphatase
VKATIARVREAHPRVRFGVASNQDDVGKGKISFDMARTLARRAVAAAGIPEADIELCPHTLEAHCACRKPSPVMIERLRGRAPNARRTLVVGNALLDVLTARHARAPFISGARFFRRTPAGPVEFIDIAAHAAPQIRASHSG